MRWPSGDHSKVAVPSLAVVNARASPPLALMLTTWGASLTSAMNASEDPFGDQRSVGDGRGALESRVGEWVRAGVPAAGGTMYFDASSVAVSTLGWDTTYAARPGSGEIGASAILRKGVKAWLLALCVAASSG